MKHSELTNKVMVLFGSKNQLILSQFDLANAIEENDVCGYFVNFSFKDKKIPLLGNIKLPDVIGKDKNGKIVIGYALFVEDGLINCLEGFTFGNNKWPEQDADISLEVVESK